MRFKFCLMAITLIVFYLLPGVADAGNVGALSYRAGQQHLVLSADVNYMLRDVEFNGEIEDSITSRRMIIKRQYGIFDFLDLYVSGGFADLVFEDFSFETPLDFIYGGGIKITPVTNSAGNLYVSLDLKYLRYEPSDHDIDAEVMEYQGAGIVAVKWENFVPYGGFRYSDIEIDVDGIDLDAEADIKFGIILGSEYFINPNIFFNIEIQIFDLNGIYAGVGYRF